MTKIVVTVGGGCVRSVYVDAPNPEEINVEVIDFDETENLTNEELRVFEEHAEEIKETFIEVW